MKAKSPVSPPPPPLARDSEGNPLSVPSEAAAWRVRRRTGGRPSLVLAANGGPLQLPLATTEDDLVDLLPPGSYRLQAVTADGAALPTTTDVQVAGEERDSNAEEASPPDWRALLEANTQMARALSDSLKTLVDAQADWIKGIASARVIPRQIKEHAVAVPMVVAKKDDDDDDDDDDDGGGDSSAKEAPKPSVAAGMIQTFVSTVGPENMDKLAAAVVGEVMSKVMKGWQTVNAAAAPSPPAAPSSSIP